MQLGQLDQERSFSLPIDIYLASFFITSAELEAGFACPALHTVAYI